MTCRASCVVRLASCVSIYDLGDLAVNDKHVGLPVYLIGRVYYVTVFYQKFIHL